jgi:hypothetical protein
VNNLAKIQEQHTAGMEFQEKSGQKYKRIKQHFLIG